MATNSTLAPYLYKSLETQVGEMKASYPGSYQQLADVTREVVGSQYASVAGGGFEALRYANIPENLPVYESRRGQPGNIPELERHAGEYRGETYQEYTQRLGRAGYRPSYGPGSPSGLAFAIRHIGNVLESGRWEQAQKAAPLPQPSPSQAPIGQPVETPLPTISVAPAPAAPQPPAQPQPAYSPIPTQQYQSTYYQANGYQAPSAYQSFGDKPFAFAYQKPRLYQSYTGI